MISVGTQVKGNFNNTVVTGVVTSASYNQKYMQVAYMVKLDQPVKVRWRGMNVGSVLMKESEITAVVSN
jgi:hypothetical protein